MADPTERLEQRRGRVPTVARHLATGRALPLLISAAVTLVVAAVLLSALLTGNESPLTEAQPRPVPVAPAGPADAVEEAALPESPAEGPHGPRAATTPTDTAAPAAPAPPREERSIAPPVSARGCPQPGVPGRDVQATQWEATGDLFAHVPPEEWYVSAWCATEAVAQSLGADGWQVSNWSDSRAVALLVVSGLEDDAVFAAEYEVEVVRAAQGWSLDPEYAAVRFWCSRGVDEGDPSRCV